MACTHKSSVLSQIPYNSLYVNPLTDLKHNRSFSEGCRGKPDIVPLGVHIRRGSDSNKENVVVPSKTESLGNVDKENAEPNSGNLAVAKKVSTEKFHKKPRALKPTSLQLCMQMNEPDFLLGSGNLDNSEHSSSLKIWDYSDSESAPASSWSTIPNRTLLCRPLPVDIGRCTCVIVKEKCLEGLNRGSLYTLYTNEGHGRQNRKLAVAHHKRHNGRSEFIVAQSAKGILSPGDDSFVGTVTSNLMGSKYNIWDQGRGPNSMIKQSKLLAAVTFIPTIASWSGSHRSMKAWVPKHQSMQLKSTSQVQHINGLPKDWEEKMDKVHQLFSRIPHYNSNSKQYELDFRERRGKNGLKIKSSVKNFQLTLEKYGRQAILQLGRVGKSTYVMDYRYPMTGYQAFCICLASIDSKLCCTM
ncbi:hypothetical protein DCAR_0729433 [Daucus carota subsp. sativus]|uniref:Uncharacterized protein n=1 Tax=Daucus carota subsp. sativus TaxID=79200 RepID=A0A164U5N0_DAUCS|nr:PREDICTED: tubby-like protein 8 [Daucus carota subsp. sativus]WOH09972.1 hypothetical protein DCAR_0729433 [Daucus carota subsp. sativus]